MSTSIGQSTESRYDHAESTQISTDSSSSDYRKTLIDRIKGCLYGLAIGDAIGLATEFMTREEAEIICRAGPVTYSNWNRDHHRSIWEEGDWTDDTDQMLLIMKSFIKNKGSIDPLDFANRLILWEHKGFPNPPFNDTSGRGIGFTVAMATGHPLIKTVPKLSSLDIWTRMGNCQSASNGALMRTAILGIPNFNRLDVVINQTTAICETTHADPRCIASCIAVTVAIAEMLKTTEVPNISEIISTAEAQASIALQKKVENLSEEVDSLQKALLELSKTQPDFKPAAESLREIFDIHRSAIVSNSTPDELHRYLHIDKLDDLSLDEHIGYTYKCLGVGFLALRSDTTFKEIIMDIVKQGGDADTNCAVAGALLGCKLGYSQLPNDWLEGLRYKSWLDKKVHQLIDIILPNQT